MNQKQIRRAFSLLFALMLLIVIVSVTFAMAAHADCCVQECDLCLEIAKLQGNLRLFDETLGVLTGLLALLVPLHLAADAFINKQNASNLVALKTKLNN